mmetsp:Transcript_19170/g.48435  ORF Transcript_19170/g.48435 Transcript_19170/m.48435 type:complete len:470 (-) Transcript_19170:470-1879(-)
MQNLHGHAQNQGHLNGGAPLETAAQAPRSYGGHGQGVAGLPHARMVSYAEVRAGGDGGMYDQAMRGGPGGGQGAYYSHNEGIGAGRPRPHEQMGHMSSASHRNGPPHRPGGGFQVQVGHQDGNNAKGFVRMGHPPSLGGGVIGMVQAPPFHMMAQYMSAQPSPLPLHSGGGQHMHPMAHHGYPMGHVQPGATTDLPHGGMYDQSSKHNKYCHFCQHLKVRASGMLACGNKDCTRRFCEHCLSKSLSDDVNPETSDSWHNGKWHCPVCRKICCCCVTECKMNHRHCKAYRYRRRRAEQHQKRPGQVSVDSPSLSGDQIGDDPATPLMPDRVGCEQGPKPDSQQEGTAHRLDDTAAASLLDLSARDSWQGLASTSMRDMLSGTLSPRGGQGRPPGTSRGSVEHQSPSRGPWQGQTQGQDDTAWMDFLQDQSEDPDPVEHETPQTGKRMQRTISHNQCRFLCALAVQAFCRN